MPKPIQTPDRLFDRTWRPGHPYRPRLTARRRIVMIVLFLILCGLIGAYRYFTNPDRVRDQAEQYLTRLTGGSVTVGKATLSIFQGLRLENVRVFVDPSKSEESTIFTAGSFVIEYSPAALLQGRIDATRIVATDPRVRLIENIQTHQWNYSRLSPPKPSEPSKPPANLPEVSLRNAMVDYLETGNPTPIGSVSIDGQLSPGPGADHYSVKLQSRGTSQAMGPRADADINISTGDMHVMLYDLQFGPDLRVMLPAQVQNWWQNHHLAGDVKKTELWVNPSAPTREFKANISLDNVAMIVQPEELLSRDEMQARKWTREAFEVMSNAGLDQHGFVSQMDDSLEATPITLKKVDGDFTFTQDHVEINELEATVEENRFSIKGHYDGYSPDAAASLSLANVQGREVTIPPKLKFLNSLPAEVREAYTRFRPQGTCTVSVQYDRPKQGARPAVTCAVTLLNSNFDFERFPYPIHNASGKISVDRDQTTGEEHLRIEKIHGHGIPGGPNEHAIIELDGEMGPLTPAVEVHMKVVGKNICSEPALMASFPPKTRQALAFFDAPGKGEWPTFKGDFTCNIRRLPQTVSRWDIETSIHLKDAAGSLVVFPYPMDHGTGELVIGEDHMTIKDAHFQHGDADMSVKGVIEWASDEERAKNPTTNTTLRPSLNITARNVPIDDTLIAALPPMHAKWLQKLNAQGRFDLSGKLSNSPTSGLDFAFDVSLHDCKLWNQGDGYAINGLTGNLKLTPTTLSMVDLKGKRGDSDVSAHGQVSWPTSVPQMQIVAEAKNLTLDEPLFNMLPEPAQRSWVVVRPEGTMDAKITYNGAPSDNAIASAVDVGPATQPGTSYEVVLTPRNLSITPTPVPYRLDGLTGSITITPGGVTMQNVSGNHGSAIVRFSGTGSAGSDGPWDFQIHSEKMLVDEDLKKAIPPGLKGALQSMDLRGEVGFDFSKLKVWTDTTPTTAPSNGPQTPSTNVDFAAKFNFNNASLNPGVSLNKVFGSADLSGSTRGGKLTDLSGTFDVPSVEVSGRPTTNLRAEIKKRQDQPAMRLANIQAQLVGGQLVGQIDWTYPDNSPSRYAMALILRNADIKALAGETMPDATGALSASLSMEGNFGDAATRRGGGDVSLTGENLYRIPLVLGLLQITSLSLPITSPFNDGACKYEIDGSRVTFETIELRAKEMMVSGHGHLDFDTGRVGMSFTSQSTTNWLKVPVVTDLLQGARNELLTIHVRGTIQQPEVSGTSMNTFMTTVDEVIKGGNAPPDLPPVKKRPPPKQK